MATQDESAHFGWLVARINKIHNRLAKSDDPDLRRVDLNGLVEASEELVALGKRTIQASSTVGVAKGKSAQGNLPRTRPARQDEAFQGSKEAKLPIFRGIETYRPRTEIDHSKHTLRKPNDQSSCTIIGEEREYSPGSSPSVEIFTGDEFPFTPNCNRSALSPGPGPAADTKVITARKPLVTTPTPHQPPSQLGIKRSIERPYEMALELIRGKTSFPTPPTAGGQITQREGTAALQWSAAASQNTTPNLSPESPRTCINLLKESNQAPTVPAAPSSTTAEPSKMNKTDLENFCPCTLQGHPCQYPDGCSMVQVCISDPIKKCDCSDSHIPRTCRYYLQGEPCEYGYKCHFGHDKPGEDVRMRKDKEHQVHHEVGQELSDLKWPLSEGDDSSFKDVEDLRPVLKKARFI